LALNTIGKLGRRLHTHVVWISQSKVMACAHGTLVGGQRRSEDPFHCKGGSIGGRLRENDPDANLCWQEIWIEPAKIHIPLDHTRILEVWAIKIIPKSRLHMNNHGRIDNEANHWLVERWIEWVGNLALSFAGTLDSPSTIPSVNGSLLHKTFEGHTRWLAGVTHARTQQRND